MVDIGERVNLLEKDMCEVKACVDTNLTGERSVWAALEKLTLAVSDFKKESEEDRKQIRAMIQGQALDATKMSTSYEGMVWVMRAVGISVIVAVIGIMVGLLTHTIAIG
jgi:hypothetical protein